MDNLLNYVTPAVIAAVVAAVMSISLPWVNWGVEQRRLRRQRRIECIDTVRKFAEEHGPDLAELVQTPEYAALRRYLPVEFVEKIERNEENEVLQINIGYGRSGGLNNFRPKLLDELAKIEAKWNLL